MRFLSGLLFPLLFSCVSNSFGQAQFWGTTQYGGTANIGVVFSVNADGSNYTVQKDYTSEPGGAHPAYCKLLEVPGGKLYGMTPDGGFNNGGVIFEFDPTTEVYTKKFDFSTYSGSNPRGSLLKTTFGKIYGLTSYGGRFGSGTLFEYNPTNNVFTKKLDLSNAYSGAAPQGSLVEGSDGNLYALTFSGGINDGGTIVKYTPSTNIISVLFDFSSSQGLYPYGDLTELSPGKLYGMTSEGGVNGKGVIFVFDLTSGRFAKKFDFDDTSGKNPKGSLTTTPDGKLFGVTYQGGVSDAGTLFEFDPTNDHFSVKINFDYINGAGPLGSLTLHSDGLLYGLANSGGSPSGGTIFNYSPGLNKLTTLCSLTQSGGFSFYGSLTFHSSGKLYGMTEKGGDLNEGVLFEYDLANQQYSKKYDFSWAPQGAFPARELTHTTNQRLYGVTNWGGTNGCGTLFDLEPASGQYTKHFDFPKIYRYPNASLLQASNGKLYGGATGDYSAIYEFDPTQNILTFKYVLAYPAEGASPQGRMVELSNGKIYGIANRGGNNNDDGILYEYDPAGNIFTTRFTFSSTISGSNPVGGLALGPNNKLYGTTMYGGSNNDGTLFEFDPVTGDFASIIDFSTTTGSNPEGCLALSPNGKFYGVTPRGGNGFGILFEFDPATNIFQKKLNFQGYQSYGSLTIDKSGIIYGMSDGGGTINAGTIFKFDPFTNSFSTLYSFNEGTGWHPFGSLTMLQARQQQTLTFNYIPAHVFGNGEFDLTASTTSGLPVSFQSSNTEIASISGKTVTIKKAGTVTITASQVGNESYYLAQPVEQTLQINKANQSITFLPVTTKTFGDANFDLSASSDSSLPVSFQSSNAEIVSISEKRVTIKKAGTVSITASQPGNENHNAAQPVKRSLQINKAAQTITFADITDKSFGGGSFTLQASSTSGLGIQFTSSDNEITISNSTVAIQGAGTATITAKQMGNENFLAAQSVSKTFCVNPSKPTISVLADHPNILLSSNSNGNQWFIDGLLIPTATGSVYSATEPGLYTVQVSIENCLSETSDIQALVVTATTETNPTNNLTVYPNPFADQLIFELPDVQNFNLIEIRIFDLRGILLERIISDQRKILKLNTSNYPSGGYVWKALQSDKVSIGKLVKH